MKFKVMLLIAAFALSAAVIGQTQLFGNAQQSCCKGVNESGSVVWVCPCPLRG